MYKKSKYSNKKVVYNGIKFDSKLELKRYLELVQMRDSGLIRNLELQPKFLLQDKFRHEGKEVRAIHYVADFKYIRENQVIVEDAKGFETDVYKIKKKMFLFKYGNELLFREIKT